jgi:hypothetical protein
MIDLLLQPVIQQCSTLCRDDIEHPGKSIAWGRWAITNNDPEFRGKGASDSGDDYGPAPGGHCTCSSS